MSIKVFASAAIKDSLEEDELNSLVRDFKHYKETGELPDSFGRDVEYIWPKAAVDENLYHLHINEGDPWPIHAIDCQWNRTSDSALIYCPGFQNSDYFLLIHIVSPGAHEFHDCIDSMQEMARVAESFRNQF